MSLWTPSGEHEVARPASPATGSPSSSAPRPPNPGPAGPAPGSSPPQGGHGTDARAPGGGSAGARAGDGPGSDQPEDDAQYAEELRRQLAATPPEVVVGNHCYGLFELAAVYLSSSPPQLAEARLAIDALGYLVDGLGPRLGASASTLHDALAQIRLAYVQLDSANRAATPNGTA